MPTLIVTESVLSFCALCHGFLNIRSQTVLALLVNLNQEVIQHLFSGVPFQDLVQILGSPATASPFVADPGLLFH